MQTPNLPETLLQAIAYFDDEDRALTAWASLRWPSGVRCPHCDVADVTFMASRRVWQCKGCRKQFSAKVGTIFEDSALPLSKWMPAIWMIANCKNGISSYELARDLGITQKSAWHMLHRIRLAMQTESFGKFGGSVEADETFVGGAARFMSKSKRERVITGGGSVGKIAVMGLLERHGDSALNAHSRVRAQVVGNTKGRLLKGIIRENVEAGSTVHTDALASYHGLGLSGEYVHNVINHAEEYVRGTVHTNGIENFWSLLKRSIKGTYVSVEPFHLFRYLDEQAFRFNNRTVKDGRRFEAVAKNAMGKRVTYKALIGSKLSEDKTN